MFDVQDYDPALKYGGDLDLSTLDISNLNTLDVAGTLTVDGASTLTGAVTMAAAATVGTTLGVTGATTLSSTVAVTGDATFSADIVGGVTAKSVAFIENGSGTSYVGTVPIPAGTQLLDIIFVTGVLWDGTSASLIIGDDDDPNGYLEATNLKATDLLVGEQFRLSAHGSISAESGQTLGKEGVYVVNTTGKVGQATADAPGGWYTTANNIIATITPGAADGSAGRSYMTVLYTTPTAIAQVAT